MKEISEIEKVFTVKGKKYVVEFNFFYDQDEYTAEIMRVECFQTDAQLSVEVFKEAQRTVDAESAMLWQEYTQEADADYY